MSALDQVRDLLGGKWKLDRSEGLDDFLKELGLNIVFRKMASMAKPVVEFKVEEDTIYMLSKVSFFNQVMTFKLNGPHRQSFEGLEMNCTSTWENNRLSTEAVPVEEGKGKAQRFTREVIDGELVQTMSVGDVVCKRVFKRVE